MAPECGRRRTAAARTSGRLSMPVTRSRRPFRAEWARSESGMSAAPVPMSRIVSDPRSPASSIDPVGGQCDAAQPPIGPLEVAQVAAQRRRVIERPIQQLRLVGDALHHRAGYSRLPSGDDRCRRGGPHRPARPGQTARSWPARAAGHTTRLEPIARLGQRVTFLGRISTDRFGRELRATLARDGVAADGVIATDDPTTLAMVDLDEHGGRALPLLRGGHVRGGPDRRRRRGRQRRVGRPACMSERSDSCSSRSAPPSNRWSSDRILPVS